jgi:SAM-dependent methyltransferase
VEVATDRPAGAPRGRPPGVWPRAFAAVYDRSLERAERMGMEARRARLLADARGLVVEIGAGTGLNLAHYPAAVDELVLTEPDEAMARALERRLARAGRAARVVRAPAEALPLPDASADTVVSTLVLCTVADPERALAEVARVLRPGGRLLFAEHVRADDPGLARWQRRLRRPWGVVARGCRPDQPTVELIARSALELEHVERGRFAGAFAIVRPLRTGRALRPPGP